MSPQAFRTRLSLLHWSLAPLQSYHQRRRIQRKRCLQHHHETREYNFPVNFLPLLCTNQTVYLLPSPNRQLFSFTMHCNLLNSTLSNLLLSTQPTKVVSPFVLRIAADCFGWPPGDQQVCHVYAANVLIPVSLLDFKAILKTSTWTWSGPSKSPLTRFLVASLDGQPAVCNTPLEQRVGGLGGLGPSPSIGSTERSYSVLESHDRDRGRAVSVNLYTEMRKPSRHLWTCVNTASALNTSKYIDVLSGWQSSTRTRVSVQYSSEPDIGNFIA